MKCKYKQQLQFWPVHGIMNFARDSKYSWSKNWIHFLDLAMLPMNLNRILQPGNPQFSISFQWNI